MKLLMIIVDTKCREEVEEELRYLLRIVSGG